MAYPILVGEMAKKKVTKKALSEALDLHRNAISYKLDRGSFSIEEAECIHTKFFPDSPIKELFKRE